MILALVCLLALQSDDRAQPIGAGVSAPFPLNREKPSNVVGARGAVVVALEVTKEGKPEKARVVRSLNAEADKAAMDAIQQWTFRPGMKNGNPVRVQSTVQFMFPVRSKAWRVGEGGTTAPKLLERVEPVVRNPEMSGTVQLSVEVSEDGCAEEIRVLKSIEILVDRDAIDAVSKWKFQPGTKDGAVVRVLTTVEVNFKRR